MGDVVTVFRGEDGDVLKTLANLQKEYEKLTTKVRDLTTASRAGAEASRESKSSWGELGTTILGVASGIGLVTTASEGLRLGVELTRAWITEQRELRSQIQANADAISGLARMQQPGREGDVTRQAVDLASKYGIMPGQAASQFAGLQRVLGGDANRALGVAPEYWAAVDAGWLSPDSGLAAINYGVNVAGLTPQQALNLPRAARTAFADPKSLAEAMTKSDYFGSGVRNQAEALALAGYIAPGGDAATALQGLGSILLGEEGAEGKLWSRLGVGRGQLEAAGIPQGGWDTARLAALHESGKYSIADLEGAGIDKRRGQVLHRAASFYGTPEYAAQVEKIMSGADITGVIGREFDDTLANLTKSGVAGPQLKEAQETANAMLAAKANMGGTTLADLQAQKAQVEAQFAAYVINRSRPGSLASWMTEEKNVDGQEVSTASAWDRWLYFWMPGSRGVRGDQARLLQEGDKGAQDFQKLLNQLARDIARMADSNEQMAADTARETPNRTPQPSGGR